jgi:hypothetical protein
MVMAWRDDLTGLRAPRLDTRRYESDCQSGLVPDLVTTLKRRSPSGCAFLCSSTIRATPIVLVLVVVLDHIVTRLQQ